MDNQTEAVQTIEHIDGEAVISVTPIDPSKKSTGRYRFIDELKNWEQNPKKVDDSDYERTLSQISRLGQYKPLLVMLDGTVIGGNTRLKIYRDLSVQYVWVSDLEFQEEDGEFHAYVNGERQEESFPTALDGMVEYALSDNDESGYAEKDKLMLLLNQTSVDLASYAANIDPTATLDNLVNSTNAVDTYMKYELVVSVDSEEKLKELMSEVTENGYKAKARAKAVTRRKKD